jgi:hypothetical protein
VEEDGKIIAKLRELFIARDDTWARQQADGHYVRIRAHLTDNVLYLHLSGEVTVGVYQLNPKTNEVKWICADIDPEGTRDIWGATKRIYKESVTLFNSKAIILEASRYPDPSAHVWVCFKPIAASLAQTVGKRILEKAETPEVELFPKQTDIEGGFGNLVKLPLGLHQREKKWSRILNSDTLDPLPASAILAVRPTAAS